MKPKPDFKSVTLQLIIFLYNKVWYRHKLVNRVDDFMFFMKILKVFDEHEHFNLFNTINRCGVIGNLFRVLLSIYSKLRGCVQINTAKTTEYFTCTIGPRQGDVTSTIKFNLYINELPPFIRNKGHYGPNLRYYVHPFR
jgi:hypothetical protein